MVIRLLNKFVLQMLIAMDAYMGNNGRHRKRQNYLHAIVEAKGYIIRAYEKRLRKLDKYLKNGIIDEERYLQLRTEFARKADTLLRSEIKNLEDYSHIRLMAVFDTAEAHEFKL
jgi:hypothetical protein